MYEHTNIMDSFAPIHIGFKYLVWKSDLQLMPSVIFIPQHDLTYIGMFGIYADILKGRKRFLSHHVFQPLPKEKGMH